MFLIPGCLVCRFCNALRGNHESPHLPAQCIRTPNRTMAYRMASEHLTGSFYFILLGPGLLIPSYRHPVHVVADHNSRASPVRSTTHVWNPRRGRSKLAVFSSDLVTIDAAEKWIAGALGTKGRRQEHRPLRSSTWRS